MSSSSPNAPVKVRADFVRLAATESVALSTTGLEEGGTLSSVTYTERCPKRSASSVPFREIKPKNTYQQRKTCLGSKGVVKLSERMNSRLYSGRR